MSEGKIRASDLSGVLHTWLNHDIEELEFKLPSGKVATELYVTNEEAVFRASEEFGEGFIPYADSPDTHRDYLDSEDVAETDGTVEYTLEHGSVELPRVIYFEQRVEFEESIEPADPETIAGRLQEELNAIPSTEKEIEVAAPDSL